MEGNETNKQVERLTTNIEIYIANYSFFLSKNPLFLIYPFKF